MVTSMSISPSMVCNLVSEIFPDSLYKPIQGRVEGEDNFRSVCKKIVELFHNQLREMDSAITRQDLPQLFLQSVKSIVLTFYLLVARTVVATGRFIEESIYH
jgi:hypothetical protein